MLQTHGFNLIAETLSELSMLFRAQPQDHTTRDSLRRQFQAFLSGCQPRIPRVAGQHPTALIDGDTWGDLVGVLREKPEFDTICTQPSANAPETATLCLETIAELAEQLPHFDTLFDAAIDALVFADADQQLGGTPDHALGVLWINPHVQWTRPMMREFLIQQFTQALLNIDRYRHGHTCTQVAVLGRTTHPNSQKAQHALQAVHNIVIASEIVALRTRVTGEPTPATVLPATSELASNALATASTLSTDNTLHGYLSPRAVILLNTARSAIQQSLIPAAQRPPIDLGANGSLAAPDATPA